MKAHLNILKFQLGSSKSFCYHQQIHFSKKHPKKINKNDPLFKFLCTVLSIGGIADGWNAFVIDKIPISVTCKITLIILRARVEAYFENRLIKCADCACSHVERLEMS